MNKSIIGFSSGCLYKTHNPLSKEIFEFYKTLEIKAVEIHIHEVGDIEEFGKITSEDLEYFDFVSVHAPIYRGDHQKEQYIRSLKAIEKKHREIGFDQIVIHPDLTTDWDFFKNINLPYSIENMDSRKSSCKDVTDLEKTFKAFDASFVLDVNHVFTNDKSMKLTEELLDAFGSKLVEIHLSGFETFHDALYKTKQDHFIRDIKKFKVPIIIESVLDTEEDLKYEYDYVKRLLN